LVAELLMENQRLRMKPQLVAKQPEPAAVEKQYHRG
jgi:hypothetical protein